MKYILILLSLILLVSCGDDEIELRNDCIPAQLQNGIIAFYSFNNGSLADGSLNSNDLINSTSAKPSTDRNGNFNCAYQFENSQIAEEFLTASNTDFLNNLDEFSISIWYEPIDTTRAEGIFEVLISRGDEGRCPNRRGEWSIGLYDCRRAVFGHNNSVWANTVTGFSNGCKGEVVALTDRWHHVVATKNGDEYKIYINGNLDKSESGMANCTNLHIAEDVGDMFIGNKYTGKIDDILIYNRELSQSEIANLFVLEPCCQ